MRHNRGRDLGEIHVASSAEPHDGVGFEVTGNTDGSVGDRQGWLRLAETTCVAVRAIIGCSLKGIADGQPGVKRLRDPETYPVRTLPREGA